MEVKSANACTSGSKPEAVNPGQPCTAAASLITYPPALRPTIHLQLSSCTIACSLSLGLSANVSWGVVGYFGHISPACLRTQEICLDFSSTKSPDCSRTSGVRLYIRDLSRVSYPFWAPAILRGERPFWCDCRKAGAEHVPL